MKNFFLPLLSIVLFASCGSNATSGDEADESARIDTLDIEKFALDFYQKHENLGNNSITQQEAAKEFQKQFKEAANSRNLLKGLPMNLRTLKDQNNGKYTAHFWSVDIDRKLIHPFEDVNFDIAVTIPREVAVNLVEKSNYLLDVDYIAHIDRIEAFQRLVGYNDWVQTESFELSPKKQYDGTQVFDIDLGLMLVDFKDIKPYSRYE